MVRASTRGHHVPQGGCAPTPTGGRSPDWADQPTCVVVVSAYALLMRLPDLRLADGVLHKPIDGHELRIALAQARSRSAGGSTIPCLTA